MSNRDPFHLDMLEQRAELAADLERAGMIRGSFIFADGAESPTYFDKYLVLSRPGMLVRAAKLMAEELPEQVDRLASTSAATAALASQMAVATGVQLLLPREGDGLRFGGEIYSGAQVVLVEDVISTGHRALTSVHALNQAGGVVSHVLCMLDRERGGAHRLEAAGVVVRPLFRERELG